VEDIFGMMVKKKYGPNVNMDLIVNMIKATFEIYFEKEVVEVVE